MAQVTYRGNLSASAFPFLSSQFGRTVIVSGQDQVGAFGDNGAVGNIPQAYYLHNAVPTAQGYKSVGYKSLVPTIGVTFDRVIPIRDPDMRRGWIGITIEGFIYMYTAGDNTWTDVSAQTLGWTGGGVSTAFANGYTYLCLANFGVFKLSVANKTLTQVVLNGLVVTTPVAITSCANYLIVTDGTTIFWSSTIDPEDFVPSQVTGAGSGKPSDVEGLIVTLVPLNGGYALYTSVNVVIAAYSQNSRFPWIFKGATGSKGVADVQHITASGDDGASYAWTSAGLQKVNVTGAVTIMADVTDFLAGQEFEDFDSVTNTLTTRYLTSPLKLKLAFIAARYLVISYGGGLKLTHALVYDTALKRWGKLKISHVACFEVTLNSDGIITTSSSASAKKTLGLVTQKGEVLLCDFIATAKVTDSVILLGKYQLIRSRLTTLDKVSIETVDSASAFEAFAIGTLDGKSPTTPTPLTPIDSFSNHREYASRTTGVNISILLKGKFNLSSFVLTMHLNGRR